MIKRTSSFRIMLVAGAMALGGCQQTDQLPLAAQGAAVGAGAGALLGALVGGNNRGQSAAIGAGAGALLGALAGGVLQGRQEGYAATEQQLTGRERNAQEIAQQMQAEAGTARSAAGRMSGELASLRREISSGRGLNARQAQLLDSAKRDRDRAQTALNEGEAHVTAIRRQIAASGGKAGDDALSQEAARIERSNVSLADSLRRMNADLGRIEI